jgi:hypothetical protein
MRWSLATEGRLHNDTAYSLTVERDGKGIDLVVRRLPRTALKSTSDIGGRVLDPGPRDRAATAQ